MNDYLLIFDIDGTLTDTVKVHQECYIEALKEMNLEQNHNGFNDYKHHTDRYIFQEIYKENKGEYPTVDQINLFFLFVNKTFSTKIVKHKVTEIKGASSFIKNILNANNIPYVFATGSIWEAAMSKLSIFDIDKVEALLTSSDFLDTRESIIETAIERASQHYQRNFFSEKVILGDGKWDYLTAKELGLSFLGIGNNSQLNELLREHDKKA